MARLREDLEHATELLPGSEVVIFGLVMSHFPSRSHFAAHLACSTTGSAMTYDVSVRKGFNWSI